MACFNECSLSKLLMRLYDQKQSFWELQRKKLMTMLPYVHKNKSNQIDSCFFRLVLLENINN
uniref:Uncharacterized protein n=1 Tax=Glycine max TaxID=3847 RepID=C6TGY3_SOYBN|nr:unknown [Glycine max]